MQAGEWAGESVMRIVAGSRGSKEMFGESDEHRVAWATS